VSVDQEGIENLYRHGCIHNGFLPNQTSDPSLVSNIQTNDFNNKQQQEQQATMVFPYFEFIVGK